MGFTKSIDRRKAVQVIVAVVMLATMLLAPLRALLGSGDAGPSTAAPAATTTAPEASAGGEGASGPADEPAAATPAAAAQGTPAGGEADSAPAAEPRQETRAVWISRWDLQEHSDVQEIVDNVARANMNVIFFQVRGQADALYRSDLEPWAAELSGTLGQDPGWDPLAEMIAAAHAKGIEVHAWMNVYPAWRGDGAPASSVSPTPMYHEYNGRYGDEWVLWQGSRPMQIGDESYLWANPAHPAVAERIVEVGRDLLQRYELDGLHLDYARYAGPELSLDPVSNRAYSEAAAEDPGLTCADWQRDQITGLVQRLRDEALPERPGARLTATAWPVYKDRWGWYRYRDGYGTYYQDSRRWARDGLVAAIVPMTYGVTIHDHLDRYQALASAHVQGSEPGGVILGIDADYDDVSALMERIRIARELGARGQAFFSYRALEEHGYWAELGAGPYQEPAVPNWP